MATDTAVRLRQGLQVLSPRLLTEPYRQEIRPSGSRTEVRKANPIPGDALRCYYLLAVGAMVAEPVIYVIK